MMRMLPAFVAVCLFVTPGFAQAGDSGDFAIPRGIFMESNLGGFLRFGGLQACKINCEPGADLMVTTATSSAQPFVGFAVGKDLNESFGLQVLLGTGFVKGGAVGTVAEPQMPGTPIESNLLPPEDYSLTYITPQITYLLVLEQFRLGLELKIGGGLVIASNGIKVSQMTEDMKPADLPSASLDFNVSGGVSLKYLTLLTGFVVGVDIAGGYVVGGQIPYMHISPAVKYIF